MKHCVVLGANGFIGSHVCEALLKAGHSVVAFDISRDFVSLQHLASDRLERCTGDFLDRVNIRSVLRGAHWVFHLVSTTIPATSNQNMVFDVQTNVVASIELLEECLQNAVEKVVFASSGGTVYGIPEHIPVAEDARHQPIVSYGNTKLIIEKYCYLFRYQFNLNTLCLRLANPYGSGHHGLAQGVIPVFLKRILAGSPITIWGDGTIVRDYIYIKDVAKAFLRAAEYQGTESVFNIGSGQGSSLRDLLGLLEQVTGRSTQVIYEAPRRFDVPEIVLDIGRARTELDWSPQTALCDGIRRTWEALKARDRFL